MPGRSAYAALSATPPRRKRTLRSRPVQVQVRAAKILTQSQLPAELPFIEARARRAAAGPAGPAGPGSQLPAELPFIEAPTTMVMDVLAGRRSSQRSCPSLRLQTSSTPYSWCHTSVVPSTAAPASALLVTRGLADPAMIRESSTSTGAIHSAGPALASGRARGEPEQVDEVTARLLATATRRWSSLGRRPPTSWSPQQRPVAGTSPRTGASHLGASGPRPSRPALVTHVPSEGRRAAARRARQRASSARRR